MITSKRIPALAAIITGMFLPACSGDVHTVSHLPDGGFTEAFFDLDDLRAVANDDKVHCFHFYNAHHDGEATGTVLAMGAYESHEELYSWSGPWYRRYKGLVGGGADCVKMIKSDAKDDILNLGEIKPFAAVFTVTDVLGLITKVGADGIRLTPMMANATTWTMALEPVKFEDGRAEVIGTERLVSTTPCPEVCGEPPTYFLHRY
ncbi:MAG TPA: hypothetical protein PL010_07900 [Flavobacteriales bacterium]|nr:hypothetical protein [Flavobacteriales bacterium]HNE79456.1 hypothetical protein [Flavobacteriales bacterium]HNI04546.1 hypothetical protein [Flavobacteriales bacterium]HNK43101.1 hypothetical protein [Flavobacteriales bacterium]HNK70075.1 hypothetical protein [Flavobacteriales bacterium]